MARHNSKQDYGTPRDFLDAVERRWGKLSFNLAAEAENCKASERGPAIPRRATTTSRTTRSSAGGDVLRGVLWLNPPFGNIAPWAEKCAWEASRPSRQFERVLFLVPASVGSEWFARNVFGKARVHLLVGRLCFDGKCPYPKDCLLAEYGSAQPPEIVLWRWKD